MSISIDSSNGYRDHSNACNHPHENTEGSVGKLINILVLRLSPYLSLNISKRPPGQAIGDGLALSLRDILHAWSTPPPIRIFHFLPSLASEGIKRKSTFRSISSRNFRQQCCPAGVPHAGCRFMTQDTHLFSLHPPKAAYPLLTPASERTARQSHG